MTSILTSIKKTLGLPSDHIEFDEDVILHINSVFSVLTQLGVGPELGFFIEDDTAEWATFFGGAEDPRYNLVKTFMALRVRLLFDPPTTSFQLEAFKQQISEFEWRINIHREGATWVPPTPPTPMP